MTSFAVVAALRRPLGTRRVGHGGTLDPAASGVLPVAVGRASRLLEYVPKDKSYRAEITLGVATDTLDAEGKVTAERDASGVTEAQVREALSGLEGDQMQIPPMASAIHHEGRRLYDLFREGQHLDLPARPVRIDRIVLVAWRAPVVAVDVDCGPGTYIRSLARDLGERLGCGAHLSALRRTRSGPFRVETAHTLEAIRAAAGDEAALRAMCTPLRDVLGSLPWIALNPAGVARTQHGGRIGRDEVENPESLSLDLAGPCILADGDGNLIAVGKPVVDAVAIQPVKVLHPAN